MIKFPGWTKAIQACIEFLKEKLKWKSTKLLIKNLKNDSELVSYCRLHYDINYLVENMFIVYLNLKGDVVSIDRYTGNEVAIDLYPYKVIADAIKYQARAVIFLHTHCDMSGEQVKPSESDKNAALQMYFGLTTCGIQMHDFIVLNLESFYSFQKTLLLADFERRSKELLTFKVE